MIARCGSTVRNTPSYLRITVLHYTLPWCASHNTASWRETSSTSVSLQKSDIWTTNTTTMAISRQIAMLSGSSFFQTVKKGKFMIFNASLYNINKVIEAKDPKEQPLEEIVPTQYHEFLPLFNKVVVDQLPPHDLGIDHEVCLKEGETPTWGPLYLMWRAELVIPKEWLEENMSKGFICQSSSPFAASILFVKKPDGGLRFGIDYQHISSKMINNQFPIPLIGGTLNHQWKASIHTKLDVWGAYNLIQARAGDEHKVAFWTRYCLFESTVMQFGTAIPAADFQGYMNNNKREALDDIELPYQEDILIYHDSEEEYEEHVE